MAKRVKEITPKPDGDGDLFTPPTPVPATVLLSSSTSPYKKSPIKPDDKDKTPTFLFTISNPSPLDLVPPSIQSNTITSLAQYGNSLTRKYFQGNTTEYIKYLFLKSFFFSRLKLLPGYQTPLDLATTLAIHPAVHLLSYTHFENVIYQRQFPKVFETRAKMFFNDRAQPLYLLASQLVKDASANTASGGKITLVTFNKAGIHNLYVHTFGVLFVDQPSWVNWESQPTVIIKDSPIKKLHFIDNPELGLQLLTLNTKNLSLSEVDTLKNQPVPDWQKFFVENFSDAIVGHYLNRFRYDLALLKSQTQSTSPPPSPTGFLFEEPVQTQTKSSSSSSSPPPNPYPQSMCFMLTLDWIRFYSKPTNRQIIILEGGGEDLPMDTLLGPSSVSRTLYFIMQFLHGLHIGQVQYGFVHHDLHFFNVLQSKLNPNLSTGPGGGPVKYFSYDLVGATRGSGVGGGMEVIDKLLIPNVTNLVVPKIIDYGRVRIQIPFRNAHLAVRDYHQRIVKFNGKTEDGESLHYRLLFNINPYQSKNTNEDVPATATTTKSGTLPKNTYKYYTRIIQASYINAYGGGVGLLDSDYSRIVMDTLYQTDEPMAKIIDHLSLYSVTEKKHMIGDSDFSLDMRSFLSDCLVYWVFDDTKSIRDLPLWHGYNVARSVMTEKFGLLNRIIFYQYLDVFGTNKVMLDTVNSLVNVYYNKGLNLKPENLTEFNNYMDTLDIYFEGEGTKNIMVTVEKRGRYFRTFKEFREKLYDMFTTTDKTAPSAYFEMTRKNVGHFLTNLFPPSPSINGGAAIINIPNELISPEFLSKKISTDLIYLFISQVIYFILDNLGGSVTYKEEAILPAGLDTAVFTLFGAANMFSQLNNTNPLWNQVIYTLLSSTCLDEFFPLPISGVREMPTHNPKYDIFRNIYFKVSPTLEPNAEGFKTGYHYLRLRHFLAEWAPLLGLKYHHVNRRSGTTNHFGIDEFFLINLIHLAIKRDSGSSDFQSSYMVGLLLLSSQSWNKSLLRIACPFMVPPHVVNDKNLNYSTAKLLFKTLASRTSGSNTNPDATFLPPTIDPTQLVIKPGQSEDSVRTSLATCLCYQLSGIGTVLRMTAKGYFRPLFVEVIDYYKLSNPDQWESIVGTYVTDYYYREHAEDWTMSIVPSFFAKRPIEVLSQLNLLLSKVKGKVDSVVITSLGTFNSFAKMAQEKDGERETSEKFTPIREHTYT